MKNSHSSRIVLSDERGSIAAAPFPHWHSKPAKHTHSHSQKSILTLVRASCIALLSPLTLGFALLALLSTRPQTITFDYTAPIACVSSPTILNSLQSDPSTGSFNTFTKGGASIGNFNLYSTEMCVEATQFPEVNSNEQFLYSPSSIAYLKSQFSIETTELSRPKLTTDITSPIAISEAIIFELERDNSLLSYSLAGNELEATCASEQRTLTCPTTELKLEQANTYEFKLLREYRGLQAGSPVSYTFDTVSAVAVSETSISPDSIVYTKPQDISITFDKALDTVGIATLTDEAGTEIPTTPVIDGAKLTLQWEDELARSQTFTLTIDDVVATDKGTLAQTYTQNFTTSGGPQVVGTSLASFGESFSPNFTISFDYPVDPASVKDRIQVTSNNQAVAADITVSDRTATVQLASLGRCASFSVSLAAGSINSHGVDGGSAWQMSSRTLCQVVSTIGTSVEGRGIRSYTFGDVGQTYLFVAGTHGNEASSVSTLSAWIDELEANYDKIPVSARVIVVPNLNPDGYAIGERRNANGVDLNRNFPANNWKKDVTVPGGELVENGGGTAPLSEPESKLIADYTTGLNPALVLTYHATGAYAIANESGNSMAKATEYSSLSGYTALGNSSIAGIFDYDTTGAYEDWLHDGPGIPALLIELRYATGNQLATQQDAMWAMIQ